MIHHILRRLLTIPLTLLLVTFVAFIVLRVTGDPVEIFLDINATEEQRQILVARLHLDEPLLLQFAGRRRISPTKMPHGCTHCRRSARWVPPRWCTAAHASRSVST